MSTESFGMMNGKNKIIIFTFKKKLTLLAGLK